MRCLRQKWPPLFKTLLAIAIAAAVAPIQRAWPEQADLPLPRAAAALSFEADETSKVTPRIMGNLRWNASKRMFSGKVSYEIPAGRREATFILFPNMFIDVDQSTDRELREVAATGVLGEGPDTTRRLGVIQVRDAALEKAPDGSVWFSCGTLDQIAEKPNPLRADDALALASIRYESREREVTVGLPPGGTGCTRVHLEVSFLVPLSSGNFGSAGNDDLRFSGPVIPLVRNISHAARIRFEGTHSIPICATCEGKNLRFVGLPPPLHFLPKSVRVTRKSVASGLELTLLSADENNDDDSTLKMAETLAGENPGLLTRREGTANLILARAALIRNVVQRQRSEVQLGHAYLKVLPWLEKYHSAAAERAILEALAFDSLTDALAPATFAATREADSIARIASHWRLEKRWNDIAKLESLSQDLSFIPFFQGILSGQSLTNNALFLGREESPTLLDTAPMATLLPGLDGRALADRIGWCFHKPTVDALKAASMQYFEGKMSPSSLRSAFREAASERCAGIWPEMLRSPARPERIGVYRVDAGIEFRRSTVPESYEQSSGLLPPSVITDVLQIEAKQGNTDLVPRDTRWNKPDDVVSAPSPANAGGSVAASVSGPNTTADGALLKYPRGIRFQLTSLSARFESDGDGFEFQQGTSWILNGDPWSRSFSLLAQRRDGKYQLDSSFNFASDKFFWPCTDPNAPGAGNCDLQPFFMPASVGLRSVLSRPRDVKGFFEVSIASSRRSVLASTGGELALHLSRPLYKEAHSAAGSLVRLDGIAFVPAARLVTVTLAAAAGFSGKPTSLQELAGAPSSPTSALKLRWYGKQSTELAWAVAADLKWSLGMGVLFENAVLYASHQVAADISRLDFVRKKVPMSQWITSGVRLYGTLFGAKNQSISVEVVRSLDDTPYSRIALTVGRPR